MAKSKGNFEKTNSKSRLTYGTGLDECSPNCICLICKRKRVEDDNEKKKD